MKSYNFSKPLYDFALCASVPAAEKLVLIIIASYWTLSSEDDPRWVHETTLWSETQLPSSTIGKILKSLEKNGLIFIETRDQYGVSCRIAPVLHRLGEHYTTVAFLKHSENRDVDFLNDGADLCSREIREALQLDVISIEQIKREKPALGSLLSRWEWAENERARTRATSENKQTRVQNEREVNTSEDDTSSLKS